MLDDIAFFNLYNAADNQPKLNIFAIKQIFWEVKDNFLKALGHVEIITDETVIIIKFSFIEMLFGLTHNLIDISGFEFGIIQVIKHIVPL